VEGLPETSSPSTDVRPFVNPKPLLKSLTAHCLIPKSLLNHIAGFWAWVPKFLAKLDADALLNFLSHRQCNMHDTHKNRFWLIASDWTIRVGGNNSCICTKVYGHLRPSSDPLRLFVSKKKNMVRYFLIGPLFLTVLKNNGTNPYEYSSHITSSWICLANSMH
jgi:hypothetical protein